MAALLVVVNKSVVGDERLGACIPTIRLAGALWLPSPVVSPRRQAQKSKKE